LAFATRAFAKGIIVFHVAPPASGATNATGAGGGSFATAEADVVVDADAEATGVASTLCTVSCSTGAGRLHASTHIIKTQRFMFGRAYPALTR
jgi:hypothetical protein